MPPKESTPLIASSADTLRTGLSLDVEQNERHSAGVLCRPASVGVFVAALLLLSAVALHNRAPLRATGPYQLLECQEGAQFIKHYDYYQGADSLGSAGYNVYVGPEEGLLNVTHENGQDYIYMHSAPVEDGGYRHSVRLEGKRRFDRGLFVLDVAHMPAGCGVWPAFWLTDEDKWPDHGEIDILEGINTQSVVKTALHTSDSCSMYAHVPSYSKTGVWDTATGIPDTYTGERNFETKVEADNCWVMAPHQWANQGCVAVAAENGTIGEPMNKKLGGIYVLEWDPEHGYIKSWVFARDKIPDNLQNTVDTASFGYDRVLPEPDSWPLPYAYFAIGEGSGCSADHFLNMRLVFNLAFCGAVAGNRFFKDCPVLAHQWNVSGSSVETCNAYLNSNPKALEEAYWKIKGVYVFERALERNAEDVGSKKGR